MYTIYGIPNCDTVKKTLTWLQKNRIACTFHDYKQEGITTAKLKSWSRQVGWELLLNKKGTTWRGLDAAAQAAITTEAKAIKLMQENTSSIKRPVIEKDDKVITVGFDEARYKALFAR